jgi:two-component system chemotaxis response regulator CheB
MKEKRMPTVPIVVVGASAGGLVALRALLKDCAATVPAAIFIVWHVAPHSPSMLPELLQSETALTVAHARDGEPICAGRVYVAPPDRHMLLDEGSVRVTRGPKENRFRPSIDALFRSAAYHYGPQVIGVVLTGLLDDGTAGMWAIKDRGGITVVQDPADAANPAMPSNVIANMQVDYQVPVAGMCALIARLVQTLCGIKEGAAVSDHMKIEKQIAASDNALESGVMKLGVPSTYTCPECHGVLLQWEEGGRPRFRCHTGHAYGLDSLLTALTEAVDRVLWNALRGMEEEMMLLNQMLQHSTDRNDPAMAARCAQEILAARERSRLIKLALHEHDVLSAEKLRYRGA